MAAMDRGSVQLVGRREEARRLLQGPSTESDCRMRRAAITSKRSYNFGLRTRIFACEITR